MKIGVIDINCLLDIDRYIDIDAFFKAVQNIAFKQI